MTARSIFSITSGSNFVKGVNTGSRDSGAAILPEEPLLHIAKHEATQGSSCDAGTRCDWSTHPPRHAHELTPYRIATLQLGMNERTAVEILLHPALAPAARSTALQITAASLMEVGRG